MYFVRVTHVMPESLCGPQCRAGHLCPKCQTEFNKNVAAAIEQLQAEITALQQPQDAKGEQ